MRKYRIYIFYTFPTQSLLKSKTHETMKYLLLLLLLPSCWAFLETDGVDICEFSQRAECGNYKITKSEVSPQNAEDSEKKEGLVE